VGEAGLWPKATDALCVYHPDLTLQKSCDEAVSVAGILRGKRLNPSRQWPVSVWTLRLVSLRRTGPDGHVRHDGSKGAPFAYIQHLLHMANGIALPGRLTILPQLSP
jgi:hypothetical protein